MNKWLSVELSLLLLVSLVAGVGLLSSGNSASSDDSLDDVSGYAVNDLSGFATACGGTTYGNCGQNYRCKRVSQKCLYSLSRRCMRYAPVYGCVYVPPPKPTPLSCVVEGQQLSSSRTCC